MHAPTASGTSEVWKYAHQNIPANIEMDINGETLQINALSSVPVALLRLASPRPALPSKSPHPHAHEILPAPVFRRITPPEPVPPALAANKASNNSRIEFTPPSIEALNAQIEYDIDEQDLSWIDHYNKAFSESTPSHSELKLAAFAIYMDRLEKVACFVTKHSDDSTQVLATMPVDEDAVCSVCGDGDCETGNAILFCDACNIPVHQDCYGVPFIPEGQWLCRKCQFAPTTQVNCILCPLLGGAFKETDTREWCHVFCAMWVPEVNFLNTTILEPIGDIDKIPYDRYRLRCYLCKKRKGACIQCYNKNCATAYHATCGKQAGLYMSVREDKRTPDHPSYHTYCHAHTPRGHTLKVLPRTVPSSNPASLVSTLHVDTYKAAQDARDAFASLNTLLFDEPAGEFSDSAFKAVFAYWALKRHSRAGAPLIKRLLDASASASNTTTAAKSSARFLTNHYHSAANGSSHPTLDEPGSRFSQHQHQLAQSSKDQKRAGRGVHTATNLATSNPSKRIKLKDTDSDDGFDDAAEGDFDDQHFTRFHDVATSPTRAPRPYLNCYNYYKQTSYLQDQIRIKKLGPNSPVALKMRIEKVRHSLERLRLLTELVLKREKSKRDSLRLFIQVFSASSYPIGMFLSKALALLRAFDANKTFERPVDVHLVKDYLNYVISPICFQDIDAKIKQRVYSGFDAFREDFDLLVRNCLSYNRASTVYYKEAKELDTYAYTSVFPPLQRAYKAFLENPGRYLPQRPHA